MYSGKVGLVLDASGSGGNIFRQMGGTGNIDSGYEATDVYASLASSTVTVTADLTCNEDGSRIRDETISASLPSGTFAEFGLVRQGHAVTHVTIDKLRWLTQSGDAFKSSDLCNSITPIQDPDHIDDSPGYRCSSDYVDGVTSDSCLNPLYPICQGYSNSGGTITWGSCYEHTDPRDTAYTNLCRMDYYEGFSPDPCSDPAYTCSLELGTCTAGAPTTNNQNCNQDFGAGNSFPCPEDYPTCVDFLQGVRWGKCYSSGDSTEACTQDFNGDGPCTDGDFPICKYDKCYRDMGSCSMSDPWFDLTIWGDTIAIEFNWDGTLEQSSNCDGTVELSVQTSSGTVTRSGSFSTESKLSVLLSGSDGSSSLTEETTGAGMEDVTVTSLGGGVVLERSKTGDVIMEVPTNTPSCSYSTCGSVAYLDVTASNSNADQARPVRLSLSRNFETGSSISQSRPGAEITGFTVMVLDRDTQQPNGIPVHISKNWHSGVGTSIYDGSWWTANMMFYLPPGESLDLTFVITHETHQGVPQWSHAQLSLIGWAANGPWLWEESALGTGGENFVMDPHGAQRRSVITDVRPKLFDGQWKENVGGGVFLNYFDETGTMQYKKELDARLHSNGPCLSDATYDSISRDGIIKSMVQISGSRTNDLVRVFFHVRHTFVQDTSFSRLGFFMMGADTYNFASDWQDFVWGNEDGVTHNIPRTCSGGHSRDANKLYESVNSGQTIYRETLNGAGPWWFSFGPNTHSTTYGSNTQVVGDKGLVIRSFDARFGGVAVNNPSASLLCDKIELGPPSSVSSFLAGDYVDMRLEFLVLPRDGAEFNVAQTNQPGSTSLSYLSTLGSTWERVQAQATRGTTVTSVPQYYCHFNTHLLL